MVMVCAGTLSAQTTITYTDSIQWKAYDDFNRVYLDAPNGKYIYKVDNTTPKAVDRWNGAAAIWCQAIFYDMCVNAYRRASVEGDTQRAGKLKLLHSRMYSSMKAQYVNFNFDDPNTNTGWFVYDDIMWWTVALARAQEQFGTATNRRYINDSEKSFLRVWYGSAKVGDDGSYADPARGLGGGMFWEWQPIDKPLPHKPGDFRSACINFPTVIAACLLHQQIPEGRPVPTADRPTQQTREWYLEKAKEVFDWANRTLVQNGRVADGIHGGGPEFKDHLYNQATYIGAACLLYQITGETKYLNYARLGANYTISTAMSPGGILPFESGIEQGIYCAIFAQYMHTLIYDCGLTGSTQTRYLNFMKKNIQKAWDNRDQTRGISNGIFKTATPEGSRIDSYAASSMPAMMLMFPLGDSETSVIDDIPESDNQETAIYTLDGKKVLESGTWNDLGRLDSGIYVYNKKKVLVRQ